MRQICGEDLDEIAEFVRDKGIGTLPKNTKALYSPIGVAVEEGEEDDLADDVLEPRELITALELQPRFQHLSL